MQKLFGSARQSSSAVIWTWFNLPGRGFSLATECKDGNIHFQCWNCSSSLDCFREKFFCNNCNCLQPPVKCVNYFQYLDLPVTYEINSDELAKIYRRLQSEVHPDKFGQKSSNERNNAEAQSAVINKAYRTLSRPLERALYLLQLLEKPLGEEDIHLDPIFLSEVLETNETIMEAEDISEVKRIAEQNKQTLRRLELKLKEAFGRNDLNEARHIAAQIKYYVSIENHANQRLGLA